MSHASNAQVARTYTLPPATETDLMFDAEGMDVTHAQTVVFVVTAGAADIETITRYRTARDVEVPDSLNFGPVAAGQTRRYQWDDVRGTGLRVTGTSAVGGTAVVEALALG